MKMAFTPTEVNGWLFTIAGLDPANGNTQPVPNPFLTQYVNELNTPPPPATPEATPAQIQANLENFPVNANPPPANVITDTFFRTTVADFVLREFQLAWGVVPTSGAATSQYDAWVARVLDNPANMSGGGMSQALAGTPNFMLSIGATSADQPATIGMINALAANAGVAVGAGAMANVGLPIWQVLQNFALNSTLVSNALAAPIANFQNLLLNAAPGAPPPAGNILTLPGASGSNLNLTTGIDTPTTGFSGHGATATQAGAVFVAAPGSNVLGASNTLNAGDNLVATGAALGNSTLNFTAVDSATGNQPDVVGLTMTGVSGAVVTVLTGNASLSGTITGLTAATLAAGSVGDVQFGAVGNGLNTALTNVTVNAAHDLTATMTAAALAAAPTGTVNVNGGVVGAGASLQVDGSTIGYSALTVNSAGPGGTTTNGLTLDTDATNTATITATGAEFLTLGGTALDIHNLHTFTGNGATADTGGLNVFFTNNDGLGQVAATGGSGVNTFEFGDNALTGAATFDSADTVNGGTGGANTNTLIIDATQGPILLGGVGANITNIATIEHNGAQNGTPITADLSLMALSSATTLDLHGDYNSAVTVNNITNAQTVEFSGTSAVGADLTLLHASPATGQFINFTMSQNAPDGPGGTLDLQQLTVPVQAPALSQVNFLSTGNAANNEINNVSLVDANITVTGATHYQLGDSGVNGYIFQTPTASGVIDASASTGGGEVWLGNTALNSPFATQTFIAGTGTNLAHVFNPGGDVVDFSKGGTDTVQFALGSQTGATELLTNPNHVYNQVLGFALANNDAVQLSVGGNPIDYTDTAAPVLGTDPTLVSNFTGVSQVLTAQHFNVINIQSATSNFAGLTPEAAFDAALGAATITTNAAGTNLVTFFDAATSQAVLGTTPGGAISAASPLQVIGLVHESAADYAHFASNLHFVA
jgi:hypothetical protein